MDIAVEEWALSQKVNQLKAEIVYLAEEIDAIADDAKSQPEKYGARALEELQHSHMAEVLRLRSELDGFENALLTLKGSL
jgi:hypothetical protein